MFPSRVLTLFLNWFPAGAWAGLIFYLSSLPSLTTGLGIWDLLLRKAGHVTEYFVLTMLIYRALVRTLKKLSFGDFLLKGALPALIYASSDEFHQSFVPGRGPSVWDVMIDSVGIIFAACLIGKFMLKKSWPNSSKKEGM